MVHRLNNPLDGADRLTQSVIQVTEMLGLYRAELARVLGLRCGDVGALADGKSLLTPASEAWERATMLVRVYELLYDSQDGDGTAMYRWLRIPCRQLGGVPLLLMVDGGRMSQVLAYLAGTSAIECQGSSD